MPGTDAVLEEQPFAGLALAVVVAAVGYGLITYLMYDRVNVLETVAFAVVFTLVYVAFTRYFDV